MFVLVACRGQQRHIMRRRGRRGEVAPADAVVALRLQNLAAGLVLKLVILTDPVVT